MPDGGSDDHGKLRTDVHTDKEAGGTGVPIGCEKTREGGDEVYATSGLNLFSKDVDLVCLFNEVHRVAQPLNGAPRNSNCTSVRLNFLVQVIQNTYWNLRGRIRAWRLGQLDMQPRK